jgi:light-regulated signal transduction histidine kinase (bacteriophytochrome)
MQSSFNHSEEQALTAEQLAAELQSARKQIALLQSKLKNIGVELSEATDQSHLQTQQLHDMSVQSQADAVTIRDSKAQIKSQTEELDLARRALLLQRDLEAANKELETFSYSVSHDLRSPLRAINGFAKALSEDYGAQLPEEARRYLEHIENSAIKMGTLIDDLLSFSRLSRLDMSVASLDLKAMAENIWVEVVATYPDRQFEFEVEELPRVHADRAMIRQVLVNLLNNAAKFTAPVPVAKVKLFHERREDEHVFCVQDNGVGFDERYIDKLFGPFQRLHKAKDFPGTGIGLALVQRIIHRHGGKCWAQSKLGEGAAFYFSLPT